MSTHPHSVLKEHVQGIDKQKEIELYYQVFLRPPLNEFSYCSFMRRHFLSVFKRPAIGEVSSDSGGAKRVTADPFGDTGCNRAAADHAPGRRAGSSACPMERCRYGRALAAYSDAWCLYSRTAYDPNGRLSSLTEFGWVCPQRGHPPFLGKRLIGAAAGRPRRRSLGPPFRPSRRPSRTIHWNSCRNRGIGRSPARHPPESRLHPASIIARSDRRCVCAPSPPSRRAPPVALISV